MKTKSKIVGMALLASIMVLCGRLLAVTLPGFPPINITPRTFTGGFIIAGDLDNIYGNLDTDHPKCVLTVPTSHPGGAGQGYGPNGSILLNGSSECAGSYELFLSSGAS